MTRDTGPTRAAEVIRRLTPARRREHGRPAFLDGLLLGAMVGAAIAGSTVWSRWRARSRIAAPETQSGPTSRA